MAKEAKTNAMRMLERAKVAYTSHEYPHEEGQAVDGANVARLTGQDPATVFKTLVAVGASRTNYVFVIPAARELDLKKAAKAAGEAFTVIAPPFTAAGSSEQISTRAASSLSPAPRT